MLDIGYILEELGIDVVDESKDRFICRCPFGFHEHEYQRPGFSVRPVDLDNAIWICFKGCGQGRLIDLVRKIQKVDMNTAHRWLLLNGATVSSEQLLEDLDPVLINKEGVNLHVFRDDYDRQNPKKTSRYILDRGFTPATLRSWEFRYDADVPAIVIPIFSLDHDLVGVCRREAVNGAQPRKYMYSDGFKKNQHLFGAYKHDAPNGHIVVVEGPLDCIWLHQCGVTSAVALLGANCSETQMKIMARLGSKVVLALDNDAAGYQAMIQLEEQLEKWFSVARVELPDEIKDVQDLSQEEVVEIFGELNDE